MKDVLSDTDPETERVHLDLMRRASPSRKIDLALSLSRTVIALSRDGLARRFPDASEEEIAVRWVALHYGSELANELRTALAARRSIGRGVTLPICSAEDIVLAKLEWYRRGGEVSERQWADVMGVLRANGNALDLRYLRLHAAELGVIELLGRALEEAGLAEGL